MHKDENYQGWEWHKNVQRIPLYRTKNSAAGSGVFGLIK